MANTYFYERISTKEERSKQRFNRQDASLERYSKENNVEPLLVFKEDVSGKSFDNRKEWNKLERLLQSSDQVIFKDISRFTRETENGYKKYMELMEKGVELIFIDNPTISTPYIKQLLNVAKEQDLIAKISLEHTVKLLLMVELNRVEQERVLIVKRITDGLKASDKKPGRPAGKVDKMTQELEEDIKKYIVDRSVKAVDLMRKHNISRNTFRKYVEIVNKAK